MEKQNKNKNKNKKERRNYFKLGPLIEAQGYCFIPSPGTVAFV